MCRGLGTIYKHTFHLDTELERLSVGPTNIYYSVQGSNPRHVSQKDNRLAAAATATVPEWPTTYEKR